MASTSFTRANLFDCSGLVVAITGGGSGLGAAMARGLASNGATVYILGRRLEKLEEVAKSCTEVSEGGRVIPLQCDSTSKPSLQAAAEHIAKEVGYINVLIANAGILGKDGGVVPPAVEAAEKLTVAQVQEKLWAIDPESYVDVYRTNVVATLYTVTAFIDLLDKGNKKGNVTQTSQVIITSSIGGFHRNWPQVGLAYTSSKAAVTHIIKSLDSFYIQFKIRVNGIAPGIFPSEMTESAMRMGSFTSDTSLPKTTQPLQRPGHVEEMAGLAVYMASKAGGYLAGAIELIDGGRLGVLPGTMY